MAGGLHFSASIDKLRQAAVKAPRQKLAARAFIVMPELLRSAEQSSESYPPAAVGGTAAEHQMAVTGFQMHPAVADASLHMGAVMPAPGAAAEAGRTWLPASVEVCCPWSCCPTQRHKTDVAPALVCTPMRDQQEVQCR